MIKYSVETNKICVLTIDSNVVILVFFLFTCVSNVDQVVLEVQNLFKTFSYSIMCC